MQLNFPEMSSWKKKFPIRIYRISIFNSKLSIFFCKNNLALEKFAIFVNIEPLHVEGGLVNFSRSQQLISQKKYQQPIISDHYVTSLLK